MSSCCGRRSADTCCSKDGPKQTIMDSELKSKTNAAIQDILSRKKTILDLVEELGPKLTDSNVNERLNAVTFLTKILVALPQNFLMTKEVTALSAFFIARLQDSVLLLSVTLESLQYLLSCENFSGDTESCLLALFKEVNMQSNPQEDRYRLYQIIRSTLIERKERLKSVAIDFVLGFIQAMEGEKDPRCLLLVFELFEMICCHLPFDPLTDDMFEVIACYFPIFFEAPPNDPYGITAEDLSKKLRHCLTAHPKFAPLCAQLLEEQLREEWTKTKRESFILLDEALRKFPPNAFAENANIFWDEIRKQVMAPKSDDLEQVALKCLESLVGSVARCTDEDGRNSVLVVLIGQIFRDCEPFLANPEMQVLEPTNRMLLTAARADSQVAQQLGNRTLALFLEKYQTKTTSKKVYAQMILEWCRLLKEMEIDAPFFAIRNAFTSLLIDDTLLPNGTAEIGFQIATCLLSIKGQHDQYFSDQDCLRIASQVLEIDNSTGNGTDTSAVGYLRQLAISRWQLIENQLLPIMEAKLNETTKMLPTLACLIIDWKSAKLILPRIINSFTVVADADHVNLMDSIDAVKLILRLNSRKSDGFGNRPILLDGILDEEDWSRMCDVVRIAAEELATLITDDGVGITDAFERVCDLAQDFVLYGTSLEAVIIDRLANGVDLQHLDRVSASYMLIYVERIVSAMSTKEIQSRYSPSDLNLFRDELNDNSNRFMITRIARINACIINKLPAGLLVAYGGMEENIVYSFLDDKLKAILEDFIRKNEYLLVDIGIESYACLCKALLLRNFQPFGDKMFSKIIDWLNEHFDVASSAVDALRFILDDNPDAPLLSIRTGAQISFLAKQRIFSRAVALLTNGFEKCPEGQRRYHFQALHVILTFAPKTDQCESEIDKLLPLLLNSIQSDDLNVLSSSVQSLKQLIANASPTSSQKLHPHIPMLCSRFAEMAKEKSSQMDLRASALDCIAAMADGNRFPAIVLNPWRDLILKQLASCLDDRKRIVRSKAVAARNKWYLVG